MGYDISIRCRTKDLKNRMEKFFKESYRFPHLIFKNPEGLWEQKAEIDKEIPIWKENFGDNYFDDYSTGLHYSMVSSRYRLYMHSVLCWMAMKVGRKQYFKALSSGKSF